MDVARILQELRQGTPGCHGIGLADLATNMVLKTDSGAPVAQEIWDDLAGQAVAMLTGPAADAVGAVLDPAGQNGVRFIARQNADAVQVLIRSHAEPPLGLCLICEADTDILAILPNAQLQLEGIASGD